MISNLMTFNLVFLILNFELGLKLNDFRFDLPISTVENHINYLMVVNSSFQKIKFLEIKIICKLIIKL